VSEESVNFLNQRRPRANSIQGVVEPSFARAFMPARNLDL